MTIWRIEPIVSKNFTTCLQSHCTGKVLLILLLLVHRYSSEVSVLYIALQLTDTDSRNIGTDINIILVSVQPKI